MSVKMNASLLRVIVKELNDSIKGNRITNLTIVNSRDYVLSFSILKEKKLLISLNHQTPFLSLFKIEDNPTTTVGQLNDVLRKELKDGYIVSIEMINNDKIIKIRTQKSNDYYEKITRILILEFIPFRPNLIITDENDLIIYAAHQSSITAERMIMKGLKYITPNPIEFKDEPFDMDNYIKEIENYWVDSKENRLKERFEPLYKHLSIRIKSLKKKINVLETDTLKAKERMIYEEYGNMILAYAYDIEALNQYLKETNIEYDNSLTPGNNANNYFKKYKKAKRTIEFNNLEIEKAKKELNECEYYCKVMKYMNEEELLLLAEDLLPNKFIIKKKNKPISGISTIEYHGNKIIFGKNAKKNDEITFKLANKNDLFMHIKDYHGSHVVIKGNNIDKETMLLGAEICLILSNCDEGDIQYTEVRNVKKGNTPGLVNLLAYQLITLKEVRKESLEMIKRARII